MPCFYLKNTVQKYDWGTNDFISQLMNVSNPDNEPHAELWMGAHPKAPSVVLLKDTFKNLNDYIAEAPETILGNTASALFDRQLPFLFKVLSAERALSIQAHPNIRQASTGFFKEEQAGINISAFNRNYKDCNHKPELLMALTPFSAMCGFKSLPEIEHILDNLDLLRYFPGAKEGYKQFFQDYLSLNEEAVVTDSLISRIKSFRSTNPSLSIISGWVLKLHSQYGLQAGILAPLFLNTIHLQPGEALYLSAGVLHAYLQGTGLEIMANSDNVLRGGLTSKHIDKDELLNILDFDHQPPFLISPEKNNNEMIYKTPALEFELSQIVVSPMAEFSGETKSAEILLCMSGECVLNCGLSLKKGDSLFITADTGSLQIKGEATIYRAKTPFKKVSVL
ncbi:MAG: mannose-6-phosphate isomerase, class I [Candidatus Cloacimonetes bacterium]|nr:mannose-6-phosphate isomerase, class I [Candidatus Cloacimonadota bacterium]